MRTNHRLSFAGVKLASLRRVELLGFSTDSESMLSLLCSNQGTLSKIGVRYIWLCDLGQSFGIDFPRYSGRSMI
jgi:hypothetical protein